MCRTVHALMQTVICGIQMLVRVFMTVILMLENVIRMVLQTMYNFISFMLQMLSLIPICVVFILTARLKCFMCGGGGPCPVARGGTCDCIMSAIAIMIVVIVFRATGVLDKIFYSLGYAKATFITPPPPTAFVLLPGNITECSRENTDTTYEGEYTTDVTFTDSGTTTDGGNFGTTTPSTNTDTTPTGTSLGTTLDTTPAPTTPIPTTPTPAATTPIPTTPTPAPTTPAPTTPAPTTPAPTTPAPTTPAHTTLAPTTPTPTTPSSLRKKSSDDGDDRDYGLMRFLM